MAVVYGIELANITKGDKSALVKLAQVLLNYKGFNCGDVDGSCGTKTTAAITLCNSKNGIRGSIMTEKTWEALIK